MKKDEYEKLAELVEKLIKMISAKIFYRNIQRPKRRL
jgi:hypothetical protein